MAGITMGRKRYAQRFMAASCAMAMIFGVGGLVLAQDAGWETDPGNTQPYTPPSPAELQRAEEKKQDAERLWAAVDSYKVGRISKGDLYKAVQGYNRKWVKSKEDTAQLVERFLRAPSTGNPQDVGALAAGSLALTLVAQETKYYCGPASAYMCLKYKGVTRHPRTGAALTQQNLASTLGTTTSGTDFNRMPGGLNEWLGSGWNFSYVNRWAPSSGDVMLLTKTDVVLDWPVVYDLHITGSTLIYNWRNCGQDCNIWHYIAGAGYNEGTNKVIYYDPYDRKKFYPATTWNPYGVYDEYTDRMSAAMRERGMTW